MTAYRFCRYRRHRASRRRAESLLGSVLSRRAADDAGRVQAVDPRPSGLVQQLHGRLLGLRPDRRPDRRQAAFRHPHPQDRRPSRSSAAGSWPSPAHVAQLEARDSRPARIVAEVPETLAPACGLFSASGYVQEALLTDYVLHDVGPNFRCRPDRRREDDAGRFVIPVTVDDLAANGLLGEAIRRCAGSARSRRSRQGRTTSQGLAVASDERIEAYVLYVQRDGGGRRPRLCRSARSSRTVEPA